MHTALIIAAAGLLVFAAHLFAGIFNRTRIPDVILLIFIGVLLGPVAGIVHPADFGAVGPVLSTITLVVMLFEGGIGLDLDVLGKTFHRTLTMTAVNFLTSMAAVGVAGVYLLGLNPFLSFMLGAIVGSTSPSIIVPLVRTLSLRDDAKTMLFVESAVSDVISITVAITLMQAYAYGGLDVGNIAGKIFASLLIAALAGVVFGFAWSLLLKQVRTLENSIFTTPAFVFMVFGAVEMLGYSGFIAALAFGITLGNIEIFRVPFLRRYLPQDPRALNRTEKLFFSEIVFLLKTFFFVYVGISIQFSNYWLVTAAAIFTLLIAMFRIPAIRFTVAKSATVRDVSLVSIMIPKGLAAAVLATIPFERGIADGTTIRDVTFMVILVSIAATSLLVFLLERTSVARVFGKIFSGFAASAAGGADTTANDPASITKAENR